jgi:pimeloyl-ACP methyl ester carboxylesterase/DNA-binding CsgD family transcriptional regulator
MMRSDRNRGSVDQAADELLAATMEAVVLRPQELLELSRRAPEEASFQFEEAVRAAPAPTAIFDPESLATAIVNFDGKLLAASSMFHKKGGAAILDHDAIAQAARSTSPVLRALNFREKSMTMPGLSVYCAARSARDWQLPTTLREMLDREGAVAVIMSFAPGEGPLARAAESFGLTALQSRVCLALLATGNLKAAADRCGISYVATREAAASAMARMGVRKLPELATEMARLAYGVLPASNGEAVLIDLWGLTLRQVAVSSLVIHGLTREQAAKTFGISLAVAKKEIETVYEALGVNTATELAVGLAGMAAVSAIMTATGGSIGCLDPQVEPLRFALRPDGTRIAYSDYGPVGGRPLLLVHSSMTSRIASRALVASLQNAGFRPVSIDRPGFGLTDMIDTNEPFDAASEDIKSLSKALNIRQWAVVARGGAQAVLSLRHACPEILGRVVLVNPDVNTTSGGRRHGPLGAIKDLYWRNPKIIRTVARILASQLTEPRLRQMLALSVAGSPPDEAALGVPGLVEDYHRSVRLFATGRIHGYVAEQIWFANRPAGVCLPVKGTDDWRVLVGGRDTLHDPEEVVRYWRTLLPDARVELLPDQGRLLAMANPEVVVKALLD